MSDDLGLGYGTRVRVFGGPSMADVGDGVWRGNHVGRSVRHLAAGGVWEPTARWPIARSTPRVGSGSATLGVARRMRSRLASLAASSDALLLENGITLAEASVALDPTAGVRWSPNTDFLVQASGARSVAQRRQPAPHHAARRPPSGCCAARTNCGSCCSSEFSATRPSASSYFTPSAFWRNDVGAEWRGWLATPRFFGDRERWLSAIYLFGADDRGERYHTGRAGLSYELANGVSVVADGLLARSRVYNGGRFSFGLRFKHVAMPQP